MFIDKKSPIPAYFQLKNSLLDRIKTGEYAIETLIPSERELSELLGISRMTVRQALNQLVSEGVLYREKGKGTFVAKPKIEQRNIMSFSELVGKRGLIPSTRVLHFHKEQAPQDVLDVLQLRSLELVYNVKRLRLANQVPIGIEQNFIPEKYFPNLEKFDLSTSFYNILREGYNYQIHYADNVIEASRSKKEERELLQLPARVPVLYITSTIFAESRLPLFFERSVYRSDEYKYNVRVFDNRTME